MSRPGPLRATPALLILLVSGFIVGSSAPIAAAHGWKAAGAPLGPGQWAARYNGPGDAQDTMTDMAVSPDGSSVIVTGYSTGMGTSYDFATVAYDATTGNELWVARYDGPAHLSDSAYGLVFASDGRTVIVAGQSYGPDTLTDFATVAYDAATGGQLWVARYNGSEAEDFGRGIAASTDGTKVFVTGQSGRNFSNDYATVAYDAVTGEQLWASTYSGPGHNADSAQAIAVNPIDSTVVVTGQSTGSSYPDFATVAYDPETGAQLWASRYDGGGTDLAFAIAISPDGSTVGVTGASTAGLSDDFATVAYDADTGTQRWVSTYGGPGDQLDIPRDIAVTPDSSTIAVTGYSDTGSALDYATIAYDAQTGAQRWLALYDGPGGSSDWGQALAVTPDGRAMFVTGFSVGVGTNFDFATVKYDASTGTQLGVTRAGRQGGDYGDELVINPDGSQVFVGGAFQPSSFGSDYGTIAYGSILNTG